MKYLSIDTETTGLDPETCEVLSFSAVLEDTSKPEVPVDELPHMHVILKHDYIRGEPFALDMNKDLIRIIKEGTDKRLIEPHELDYRLMTFCERNGITGKVRVAGKNFSSFDSKFLRDIIYQTKFHHRVLDVAPLFVNFKNDEWLPNLDQCMQRAGVEGVVTHDAYEDAKDVIKVLRTKY